MQVRLLTACPHYSVIMAPSEIEKALALAKKVSANARTTVWAGMEIEGTFVDTSK